MTYHQAGNTYTSKEAKGPRRTVLKHHAMKKPSLSSTKNRIPRQSSPHLGWFRHAPPVNKGWHRRTSFEYSSRYVLPTLKEKSSPYVGFLRHSPPSNILFNNSKNAVFKCNRSKDKNDRVAEYLKNADICTHASGRLPGGNPIGYSSAFYEFFDLAFENAKRNQNKSSSDCSKESQDSVEMLNNVGGWFLSPIAYDDRNLWELRDHKLVDDIKKVMVNFVMPYIASVMKRILFGQGNKLGFNHSLGICEIKHWDDVFEGNVHSCNSTNEVDYHSTEIDENSPLFMSVSSSAKAYHAEQVRQEMSETRSLSASLTLSETENIRRHLDIESILKLPIMTYRSDNTGSWSELESSQKESQNSSERDCDLEWSWVNVPKDSIQEINDNKLMNEVETQQEKGQCYRDNKKREESGNEHCVICLEAFKDGDRLRILPCNHRFHSSCIDKWLSGSFSYEECITSGCPTCKKTPCVQSGELITDIATSEVNPDGTVPSWAFTSLGGSLAGNIFD